jgi:hypothetical protein
MAATYKIVKAEASTHTGRCVVVWDVVDAVDGYVCTTHSVASAMPRIGLLALPLNQPGPLAPPFRRTKWRITQHPETLQTALGCRDMAAKSRFGSAWLVMPWLLQLALAWPV